MVSEVGIRGVLEWAELAYTYGFFRTLSDRLSDSNDSKTWFFSVRVQLQPANWHHVMPSPYCATHGKTKFRGKMKIHFFLSSRRRLHVVFETGCWLVSLSALAATRHQNRPRRDVSFQPTARGSRHKLRYVCNSLSLRKTPSSTVLPLS